MKTQEKFVNAVAQTGELFLAIYAHFYPKFVKNCIDIERMIVIAKSIF